MFKILNSRKEKTFKIPSKRFLNDLKHIMLGLSTYLVIMYGFHNIYNKQYFHFILFCRTHL